MLYAVLGKLKLIDVEAYQIDRFNFPSCHRRIFVDYQICVYLQILYSWWRHQTETFSALLTICAGNSPVTREFPAQRPVTRSFDVFFELRVDKKVE